MLLSVILPAKNEELLIKNTVTQISKHLDRKKIKYEIIVVVNGTTDKTEEIVKGLQSKSRNIKVVKSNPGYGVALRKGLKIAKGKFIAIYNVDFYDLHMLDFATVDLFGKDLIIGSKRTPWAEDMRPTSRKVVSYFFNNFLRYVTGFKGSDTHGIKLIRKELIKEILPKTKLKNGIFDSEFVIKIQREGYKIMDYPVKAEEVRESRFDKRLFKTPSDIYDLLKALQK